MEKRKTHAENVHLNSQSQHICDGRLPAMAPWDLKGPSSATAGIKKHSHTSNSNQILLFSSSMKAFMLTRHRNQSWPVDEHVHPPAQHNRTPYLCQHTLSSLLILPVRLCDSSSRALIHSNPFYTLCVCLQGSVFSKASHVFASDASVPFILPIRGCHFIPMETCLGSNWQIDLHDFDENIFSVGLCQSLCICLWVWLMLSEFVLCFLTTVSVFIISHCLWYLRMVSLK